MNPNRPDEQPGELPGPIEGLRDLDLAQAPARDLWTGIEARLAPRRRTAWGNWVGYAAAASVAAVIGLSLWRAPVSGPAAEPPATVASTSIATPSATPGTVLMAYAPSQDQALVKAHLKVVRSAESELRQALEQDPQNPSLLRLQQSMNNQRHGLRKLLAQRS